jgi:hypothetical protein
MYEKSLGFLKYLNSITDPNYRALSRAAPQQNLINDGDYMTEKKTQQPLGVASDLNAELDPAYG